MFREFIQSTQKLKKIAETIPITISVGIFFFKKLIMLVKLIKKSKKLEVK